MVVANGHVDLEALKSRQLLGDVVEAAGVQLRGRGRVRQGVCPFHDEAEGSFTVYGDTERFHCFGCGATGDVLDFVQRTEGLSLPEAILRLGGGAGLVPGPAVRPRTQAPPRRASIGAVVPQRDPALLTAALRFYLRSMLRSAEAREYLGSRGISFDTACRLGLGYATGDGLRQCLEAAGFGGDRLQTSGLFTEHGERFAGMVVVPDLAYGRVRWLVGRAVGPDVTPRFQALPGTKPVLGLGGLGRGASWVVVAEGLFDWLALVQWGLPAVAALGTQGMERVAAALSGRHRVFLAFDADDAGLAAAERLEGLLGDRAVAVPLLGIASDVGELATHPQGRAAFFRLLARAAHAIR